MGPGHFPLATRAHFRALKVLLFHSSLPVQISGGTVAPPPTSLGTASGALQCPCSCPARLPASAGHPSLPVWMSLPLSALVSKLNVRPLCCPPPTCNAFAGQGAFILTSLQQFIECQAPCPLLLTRTQQKGHRYPIGQVCLIKSPAWGQHQVWGSLPFSPPHRMNRTSVFPQERRLRRLGDRVEGTGAPQRDSGGVFSPGPVINHKDKALGQARDPI